MFMAQIRFVACLIILALSSGATDTNSTGVAGLAQHELGQLHAATPPACRRRRICH